MRFGIAGNLEKPGLAEIVAKLARRFAKDRVDFVVHDKLARVVSRSVPKSLLPSSRVVTEQKLARSCDLLISLGGDGTILRMARLVGEHGTPILGINLGKLGFLAEVSVEELDDCVDEVLAERFTIEERTMIEAAGKGLSSSYYALNDIVVDKFGSSRVIDIETYVDHDYLATFTGDGIIFSTPTGSTAYALSNGGPIVTPTNQTIIISPICPHTLTVRPVLVPDHCSIRVRVASAPKQVHVTADGQLEKFLTPPVSLSIRKAPFAARLVKRQRSSYYDVLRKKLHWGKDVRLGDGAAENRS